MTNIINAIAQYFNVALAIGFVVAAFFAARKGFFKDNAAIQDQAINALKARIDTLEAQEKSGAKEIERLTEENVQLRKLLHAVRHALARRDLIIEIDDDYVSIIDTKGQSSTQVPNTAKIRPMRLKAFDDVV